MRTGVCITHRASVAGFSTWGITQRIEVLTGKKHEISGPRSG